ncbi:Crp/Fnr family transcriptional regulator [uncultured Helicobacter sp.]|uniref:Crp/Fnr family transcriptional regulator n=1 Tax=uncultured Helicobacter sp. TaxID=175537 RepID=UPI00374F2412
MQDLFKMLYGMGHKRFYNDGEILFFEGEVPKTLLVLLKGKVRIYKTNNTQEATLHQICAPSFIAEMPSFLGLAYPASAVCVGECEILEISLEIFKRQCVGNAEFCLSFIASLCQKIRILESHISRTSQSLKERVREFLALHKHELPNLTQRQIAQRLNTSPESLSRVLKELKGLGIVQTQKGKISIG